MFNFVKRIFSILCIISIVFICFASYQHFKAIELKSNDLNAKNLFVVSTIFNPASFQNRYDLYKRFEKHIQSFNVVFITIELAFENQEYQVTSSNNPNHIQLRSNDYLWYKENLINIVLQKLPDSCEYVAWIDVEVEFLNLNWVEDTKYALKKYKIVQLFDNVNLLGPNSHVFRKREGFGVFYANKHKKYEKRSLPYRTTGYAWAARKSTLLEIGGLFDKGIVGDGDRLMAYALVGRLKNINLHIRSKYFKKEAKFWQKRAVKCLNKNIGFVEGSINHIWHGERENRGYNTRQSIINSAPKKYNPRKDLYYDNNGLLKFESNVRDYYSNKIQHYFENRKEDGETSNN